MPTCRSRCWRMRPSAPPSTASISFPLTLSLPLRPCLIPSQSFAAKPHPTLINCTRSVATARRTNKLLRPRPAPSAAVTSKYRQPARDTVVFNPPPSAPSPYHTPAIFLPPNDPRRQLLARSHAYENPYAAPAMGIQSSSTQSTIRSPPSAPASISTPSPASADHTPVTTPPRAPLPPPVKRPRRKTYHLGAAEIAEIRRLRATDPFVWTRKKLAERFGCTEFFVGMCMPANQERMEWHERNLEAAKTRWGPKRRWARHERTQRRELWNRDA